MDMIYLLLPLIIGWIADRLFGDPEHLPHPIVWFGKSIAWGKKRMNQGKHHRVLKGGLMSVLLIAVIFVITFVLQKLLFAIHPLWAVLFAGIIVFYCLAGKTLITEVKAVFVAVDESPEKGRMQLSRIVGRDTSTLSPQQIRTAALETLAENLSDGVIAPLFWYLLLGAPGMLTYKMINTLDSMIGYKNDQYREFGRVAARIDDAANYIPARLTAILMLAVSGKLSLLSFVKKYGKRHSSPNSGYPEAALAGILNCRFGGPNMYHGQLIEKPYIGSNNREITLADMENAVRINRKTEIAMMVVVAVGLTIFYWIIYTLFR